MRASRPSDTQVYKDAFEWLLKVLSLPRAEAVAFVKEGSK